jgi:hypothetical protein
MGGAIFADKRIDLTRRIEITHASAQISRSHSLKQAAAVLVSPCGAISQ